MQRYTFTKNPSALLSLVVVVALASSASLAASSSPSFSSAAEATTIGSSIGDKSGSSNNQQQGQEEGRQSRRRRHLLYETIQYEDAVTNPYGLSVLGSFSPDEATLSFGDLNGDDLLDCVVGTNWGELFVYYNTGTSTDPYFTEATTNPLSQPTF